MSVLLELKERLKKIYEKYYAIVRPLIKFVIAFLLFFIINQQIGFQSSLKGIIIIIGMAMLSAFLPDPLIVFLSALLSIAHVFALSSILAVAVFMIYIIIYCLFMRFAPKQSYVILALPILSALKIPYVLPILLGLFSAPVSMISIVFGVFITYLFKSIQEVAQIISNATVTETMNMFNYVIDQLLTNRYMIFTIFIYLIVYLVTFGIRRRNVKYASQVAILVASLLNAIGFLVINLLIWDGMEMVNIIIGTLISLAIALVAQFFRMTLDYAGAKNVQFEDDEYYYYVKAIPKMTVSTPEKKVTRINVQTTNSNTLNLQDEIQKAYSQSADYRSQDSYEEESDNRDE